MYEVSWNLSVSRASCDVTAHLRVRYDRWDYGDSRWVDTGWATIASSAGSGTSSRGMIRVANVRFAACDYTSGSGNHSCGWVN
ncbi:hypothetical protein [Streptomyces niveus]|uniref:hypothetical protein n=1 Tax=Streptomyces niveus TaxID=193462 RepID=UPI0034279A41